MTSTRTMYSGFVTFVLIIGVVVIAVATPVDNKPTEKRKRQIFREQVLPHSGGKIPEDAFRADRLALNRLNKDGISVPDGILLDARRHVTHPNVMRNSDLEMSVIKVVLTPDGRYAPPEGTYNDEHARTIDSTYIIRPPIGTYKHEFRRYPVHIIRAPIPAKLELPGKTERPPTINHILANFGFGASESYVFQKSPEFFSDYFHPYYTPQTVSNFGSLFNDVNHGRQSARNLVRFPSDVPAPVVPGKFDLQPIRTAPLVNHQFALPSYSQSGRAQQAAFDCAEMNGLEEIMFADQKTKCQSFHVCRKDGRHDAFVCPKSTLFNNALGRCDWWYNVRCR